jgi:cytosine/adenosine deaminase-related metal-dependent hydrolase
MKVIRARWICPITRPPIANGWIAIDDGRIAALGQRPDEAPQAPVRDLGNLAIMPGLVNAHTHLELSWLRGRVPPAATFHEWITSLFITRGGRHEKPDDPSVVEPLNAAVQELREAGVAAVGDISNSLASVAALGDAGLRAVVFHELLGFNLLHDKRVVETRPLREEARARAARTVKVSVAPHACYSVSPQMFRAIRDELNASHTRVTSVHVGESEGEMQFLRDGSGPWIGILKWVGSWVEEWQPPRCGPVEYLHSLGVLDSQSLVVHGVQLSDESLARLAEIGCTLVTCPRSNQWVGVGVPPVARFYASGMPVAVGTDSLASVADLNVFSELKAMRWLAPDIPARTILESGTLVGAKALGVGDEIGSIDVGKAPELIGVSLPNDVDNVEEYLLSGIDPAQVSWVGK